MFNYDIQNIKVDEDIYKIITLHINKGDFNIKIIPETYIISKFTDNFIEISTYHYSISCGLFDNIYNLKADFHKSGDGEGFDMYLNCTISENDFNDFRSIIESINDEIKNE